MPWSQQQIDAYMAKRARSYERKWVAVDAAKHVDFRSKPGVETRREDDVLWIKLVAGLCPCATCGHYCMGECVEHDCKCCSGLCT